MKEKWIKVALVQPKLIEDNNKNIERVENLIRKAAEDRPDVVILPERWWFINPFAGEVKEKIQEERGAQYQYAKQWAKELSINIVAGSIWEWRKGFEKPYITSYFFDNNGKEVGRQDKIQ